MTTAIAPDMAALTACIDIDEWQNYKGDLFLVTYNLKRASYDAKYANLNPHRTYGYSLLGILRQGPALLRHFLSVDDPGRTERDVGSAESIHLVRLIIDPMDPPYDAYTFFEYVRQVDPADIQDRKGLNCYVGPRQ